MKIKIIKKESLLFALFIIMMSIAAFANILLYISPVSYTHLRAHETTLHLVFFFNDTATTEIYTRLVVGSVRCV